MTTDTDTMDRQITMTCTPVLVWNADGSIGATFSFSQSNGVPAAMNGRVGSDGNIDLTALPHDDSYNDNIDITIMLDTSRMFDQSGNPVAGRWAQPGEFSGTGPVTGYGWFCGTDAGDNYSASVPITVPDMTFMRVSDTQLVIDDDTPDNAPSYAYAMGLVLPNYGNYYITLDPRISNKTSVGTNNSFMISEKQSC